MASPAQKYRFSGVPEFSAENIEQLDEMLEDLYTYLTVSPFGVSESAFNISELDLDAGFLTVDGDGELSSVPDPGVVFLDDDGVGHAVTPGTTGAFLRQGTTDPEWSTLILPNAATVGALPYASASNVLSMLTAVATGNALISGGLLTAPSWGKIGLTTHVSGVLPIANGGTNNSTAYTAGSVVFSDGTKLTQDNTGLFFDATNDRLGIGLANPSYALHLKSTGDVEIRLEADSDNVTETDHPTITFVQDGGLVVVRAGIADGTTNDFELVHEYSAGNILLGTNNIVRATLYASGGIALLGTLADPGSGIVKIDGALQITTPLAVAQGGTGRASQTAYAVLCGGTTATGAQQSIASVGTSGQVLTSNGAAALPTFQNAAGGLNASGTPVDNQVAVWTSANALEGVSGFTFDGTTLTTPGQIAFPSTQSASTGANTLDDYEEGSWTPTIEGNTGASGQTYAVQVGRYVKIGKMVYVQFLVKLSAKGTLTGTVVYVRGLPFTSESTTNLYAACPFGYWESSLTSFYSVGGFIPPNSTHIGVFAAAAAATTLPDMLVGAVGDSTGLIGAVCYRATA